MSHAPIPSIVRSAEAEYDVGLLPVATLVARRLPFITRLVAFAVVLGLAHAFLAPKRYKASASFIVAQSQVSGSLGGLSALASRFGASLPIPSLGGDNTARLFQAALGSREVQDAVLDTGLVGPNRADTVHLLDWYDATGDSHEERLEEGRKTLKKRVDVSLDDRSGILTVEVEDRDPAVAAAVATTLVEVLNQFNLSAQQTTSRATRIFLEHRLGEVQIQLAAAEDDMRLFLERNRQVTGSPTLQLEQARLQRRIDVQQQVYLDLAQQLEQARSNEVRDTPVLTVIEHPVAPVRRSWPKRKLILLAWGLAGVMVALGWVGLENWTTQAAAAGSPAWLQFRAELERLRGRLRVRRRSSEP